MPTDAPSTIPVIHAVTNDEILSRADFEERAGAVMGILGPRGAVHARASRLSGSALYDLSRRLARIQEQTGCWFVVNDRVDVALAVGARGVQLTSRSMRVEDARGIAPAVSLGASAHDVATAAEAARQGAAWIVAGHVFPTPSHPEEAERGEEFVAGVAAAVRVPVIAIGGIRPMHVAALRARGAAGVAVIRGIWHATDAEGAASEYLSSYDEGGTGGRHGAAPDQR